MKRFFAKFISSIMIALFVLVMLPGLFGHTTVQAGSLPPRTPSYSTTSPRTPSYSATSPSMSSYSATSPSKASLDTPASSYANGIALNKRSVKLVKGTTVRLKVQNMPADYTVSFQSSNTKIASVSSTGKIRGKKNGEATVTATIKHNNRTIRKLNCDVTIGPAAVSIVIPKSKITLLLGKSACVNYIIKPSNSTEVPIFTSSNKKVAKVSKTGVITTHSVGKAVITATIKNGKSDMMTVVVNKSN